VNGTNRIDARYSGFCFINSNYFKGPCRLGGCYIAEPGAGLKNSKQNIIEYIPQGGA
jgi:hypothetical protein